MLYSDKNIIISDSLEDKKELLSFMEAHNINERWYSEYVNNLGETIGEPFIFIKGTQWRYEVLLGVSYVTSSKLLEIVSRKNEKKEEQGYPRTKLLIVDFN